ncbi:hypothetical protein BJF86_02145 [Serinicoccus sp. CNJ-927]|uniref:ABC transporter permease n=1 Tax=Serinicoccus sp. CNJ-927 TaxID=1904970 RepID=UPI00095CC67B|nr:FtsX-like permease family protein [Serinicoccus sp. CNJ-927]OLT41836.1 hypothetical protein BJF86_02145 [Serinicoccus sp. CNJ-927]
MSARWMVAGLASRTRRLVAAAIAVVIGVGFLTTSTVVVATSQAALEDAVAAGLREADLVVTGEEELVPADVVEQVSALDGVDRVTGDATACTERAGDYFPGTTLPVEGATLLSGELPDDVGEIVVTPAVAEGALAEGETTTITGAPDEEGNPGGAHEVRVVGVVDPGPVHPLTYGAGYMASEQTLGELDPMLAYRQVVLDLAEGADAQAVRADLDALLDGQEVTTGPEAAQAAVTGLTGGTAVLGAVLVGFGGVALLTAALVIANTFTITLAQRTAELALLRCVGATRSQVRRSVLLEAVLLGVVASVVGVLGGIGLAAGLLTLARRLDLALPLGAGLEVGLTSLLLPLLVGVAVTVLSSLWPAARATRVSPLAALRPLDEPAGGRRTPVLRVVLALLLLAGGTGLMVLGAVQREVVLGVLGGVVSFAGVLLAAVLVVPAAVRGLGVGARVAGVPGRLAVSGAVRNPGRAASTSAALLVGVTLITMTSVGAATGQRTALGEIDKEYAVDLLVDAAPEVGSEVGSDEPQPTTPVDPDVVQRLAEVDGIGAAVPVETAYLRLGEIQGTSRAVGLDAEAGAQVLRSEELVAALQPGIIGLGDLELAIHEVAEGDTLTVSGAGGERELRVVELGVGGGRLTLHPDDLDALAGPTAGQGTVLMRLDEGADVVATMNAVSDLADEGGLDVDGAAGLRAQIVQILDVMVLVATALLGVAVVIAVVGIANTLSLSVIERRREHALLRGLGLTRGQMRLMLTVEGVLLALVSAGLGLVLGVGYAALGIQTLMPQGTTVTLDVPWARVALILGVALVAGAQASVLPARRAARVSPAEGLATT